MDRNGYVGVLVVLWALSLSARRAWIEIVVDGHKVHITRNVALRKESVDRNITGKIVTKQKRRSLSARRAWIEIAQNYTLHLSCKGRSPQGERG